MCLLYRKCDVNWPDGKYTALHIATKFFKPTNVKVLVDHKASESIARNSVVVLSGSTMKCSVMGGVGRQLLAGL